ncbi:hypothetical protein BGZ76_009907 [Entomortierella beljakovae]|nr:hypothetical protein BGZ76_009907 [Entomortierella beljakovae]
MTSDSTTSTPTPTTLKLTFVIDGGLVSNNFNERIPKDSTIYDLKEFLKEIPGLFGDVANASLLRLWRVSIPIGRKYPIFNVKEENMEGKDKEEMLAGPISDYFDEVAVNHIHIIVKKPEVLPVLKKKRWTVNGGIRFKDINSVYYVDPAKQEESSEILRGISECQLVMLVGARASGKSTRLYRLVTQLAEKRYRCIVVSFEGVITANNEESFWTLFGKAIKTNYAKIDLIRSFRDFLDVFSCIASTTWDKNEKIVLFIDEFDLLFNLSLNVRNECLQVFREIRQNNHLYTIDSIVVFGTFSLLGLNSTDQRVSSFNINETIKNPYFTREQTQDLFDNYATDEDITIEESIIQNIFSQSNGHPGMICLCGRAIAQNLQSIVDESTKTLRFQTWQKFSTDNLNEKMLSYHTFRRMVDSLLSESATDAVNLLRFHFIGFLGDVDITHAHQRKLAKFLTAEGVLLSGDGNTYRMASAFIDSFIRLNVIPLRYPNAPSTLAPKKYEGGPLDILETLKVALRFFDRDLMTWAAERSYKDSGSLKVDGNSKVRVPRESVYDTELMRILTNWLSKTEQYQITGQWYLRELENHRYSDIVIKRHGCIPIVLELLATGSRSFIRSHIEKTPFYKEQLNAQEAWVVHFTREDNYLDDPYWQSDKELNGGVNFVHSWHDKSFETLRMSARWKDQGGKIHQVDNQLLTF